ncbi:RNA polymerase sigma factor [Sorangium sp. So ce542]|uniref:RNA polymerase sigma factor n=1 Tax=Sorangium sp. So ce542 TaxID=3133316 RepID=UPI003F625172
MTAPQPPRPPLAPAHDADLGTAADADPGPAADADAGPAADADPGPAADADAGSAPEPPPRPSFEEVYTGLLRYVLRVLWRMGVPARHLRDVAQEVFLVVHRRFGDYDPRFSMKAWVASIASHLALRHQRLSRNRRELLARSEAERIDVADPSDDAEQRFAQAETQRIVRALVQRIEGDRRVVFLLYELEGIEMREIAAALEIPENTAWDRLRRARKEFAAAVMRLGARERDALGVHARSALAPLALVHGPLLLDLGDARLDLPEGLGERLWARLQARLALPEGDGGAPAGQAAGALPPGDAAAEAVPGWEARRAPASLARAGIRVARAKLAAAGAALFLGGAGTGAGALYAALPRPAPPESALVRGDVLAAVPASSGATATLAGVPAALSSAAPAPAPPAATGPRAAVPPMDTDLTLIQRAIAALGAGRATEALEALDRHARSYPRSPRAQQRETLAIQALDQSGRRAEAAARAARFREAFPGSAYLPTIEDALNGAP